MKMRIRPLALALSTLLSACASLPPSSPPTPSPSPPDAVPATIATPEPQPPPPDQSAAPEPADIWSDLRGSFAMADCDADPAIMQWASRYTRHPQRFESQLKAVLPRLAYVQQVASEYEVAGEFVLLPWVESHFHPVPARKRMPAGMWQIMPITAGAMGLRVDGHYDGRLDIPAAAHAVMKLLQQYHKQFGDWRVADYAYNAGEFSIRRIIRKHGMPPEQPTLPDWPVRKVTSDHLAKLLAIACVIREPQRFNVELPELPDERRLVKMAIPHSMPMSKAADHAGMPVDALKQLNAAFHGNTIDVQAASYLMLPAVKAEQFQEALLNQPTAPPMTQENRTTAIGPRKTYTVKTGDSLWQIARRHSLSVRQLQQWNATLGHVIKPGLVLNLSAPD